MLYNEYYEMNDGLKGSKNAVKWIKALIERRNKAMEATKELMEEMTPLILANEEKHKEK